MTGKLLPNDQCAKDSKTLSLEDVRGVYFEASKKVSESLRQYSLAGIAIIWVFRGNGQNAFGLDPKLLRAALCIIAAIALDFLQYVATTYIWFFYFRFKEKKDANLDQQFVAPRPLNWVNEALFLCKIVALAFAYGRFIIPYLWWRVHH